MKNLVLVALFAAGLVNVARGCKKGSKQVNGKCVGGNSCCSIEQICGVGEGDCNIKDDCKIGLTCGDDNCGNFEGNFDSSDDCCYKHALGKCTGGDDCCTKSNTCGDGEGDCDSNEDCKRGLLCGNTNCRSGLLGELGGFDTLDDCCMEPDSQCVGGDSCCVNGICGVGEGDCDSNSDCQTGLVCGHDNCRYGLLGKLGSFENDDDCCLEPGLGVAWMKNVPDETKITEISIPGTHDTMAFLHDNIAGRWIFTQDMTLKEQLEAGIRFLDIRLRHYRNSFPIHHDIVWLKTYFHQVLKTIVAFLESNPSEAIFLSYQEEHEAAENTKTFDTDFNEDIENYAKNFVFKDYAKPLKSTLLEDIRGKIVFINFQSDGPLGYRKGYGQWISENQWEGAMKERATKTSPKVRATYLNNLKKNIVKAEEDKTGDKFYITYCSAADIIFGPRNIAFMVNINIFAYLASRQFSGDFGIVVLDFPAEEFIARIFNNNNAASAASNRGTNSTMTPPPPPPVPVV